MSKHFLSALISILLTYSAYTTWMMLRNGSQATENLKARLVCEGVIGISNAVR